MKDKDGNVVFYAKDGVLRCKTGTFENVNVSGIIKASLRYSTTKEIEVDYIINPEVEPVQTFFSQSSSRR